MAERIVPTTWQPDWPRIAAMVINRLARRPDFAALGDFPDDTAAASGGVEIGGLYRTGSALKIRVV